MSRSDRVLVAAGGGALVLAFAAAWTLFVPVIASDDETAAALPFGSPFATEPPEPVPSMAAAGIVVDVAGAVAQPGIRELDPGARIADAIAAAGGYAADADLDAAASTLNLAQPLSDGEQVRVPRIGDGAAANVTVDAGGAAPPPAPGGTGGGDGGIINLNTATPEQLEALPGIGPVTVQKIVAARQERPFTSLEDVLERKVIHRGQLEDIQGLATAG